MTPPALPSLPGLAWSRHKKPGFSTRVASHVSGREVRVALMTYPLYEFEAAYNGLASSSTAAFASLGASSLQSLMGFFLQLQGQAGVFLYTDPDDNAVTGQNIGVGNGSTLSFVMGRTLGGFNEPVDWVSSIANVYLNGVAQASSSYIFTPPNSLGFYTAPGAGVVITADFTFAFQCRFLDDQMDFEEFMSSLWKLDSMKFRSIKANATPAAGPQSVVAFLTSGTSWTVPSNLASVISIECIGGGGGGAGGDDAHGSGEPGGGAAYAKLVGPSLTAGATVYYNIGAGGAGGLGTGPTSGSTGGDTWFNITGTNAAPASTAQGVLAKGGAGGTAVSTGSAAGGLASSSIGSTTYSGGASGQRKDANAVLGAGGGGAAGPNGAGATGGNTATVGSGTGGGGGGGGSDGGSAGGVGTTSAGGNGGNNFAGSGGGAGATVAGSGGAGSNSSGNGGGGGGGAFYGVSGAAGGAAGAGLNWTATAGGNAGPGGGGGGGSYGTYSSHTGANGGAGGLYGGGGGAAGDTGMGGVGAQGIIVITYVT
jgi:hypothetical protein